MYPTSRVFEAQQRRRARRRRLAPIWAVVAVGIGVGIILLAGGAFAWVVLHGRGELTAETYQEQDLQVTDVRLSAPLSPGGSADLLFSVRNPNAFAVSVDRVTLAGAMRKAKPAGCTSKVSGPLTNAAGYRLPAADRVLVGPGAQQAVVVHTAFRLAASAKAGCGFTVGVDVSATQLTPTASPTTVKPTTPGPTSTRTEPATVSPTTQTPPPPTTPATTPPVEAPSDPCDPELDVCE
jgi:hypothetical protein